MLREITVEEMILLEQFMAGVTEGLAILLKEKEPKSLTEEAELAGTYAHAKEDKLSGETAINETTPLGSAPWVSKSW